MGGGEAHLTLNNMSTTNRLFTVQHSGSTYVLLGDIRGTQASVDFMASTVALNTRCEVISKDCGLYGLEFPVYNCSSAFNGILDSGANPARPRESVDLRTAHFNDTSLIVPTDREFYLYDQNPSIIAMAAVVYDLYIALTPDGTGYASVPLIFADYNDSDVVLTDRGGLSFVLRCNATLHDATYAFINGSFAGFMTLNKSNDTLSRIINTPQHENFAFGTSYMKSGAISSMFSNSSQELTDKMALTYSRTALGIASGVFLPTDNILEETWENILVAKVPFAPFYSLLAANFLFVFAGVLLFLVAFPKRRFAEIVSLFTMSGIVAYAFGESSECITSGEQNGLFEEDQTAPVRVVGVAKAGIDRWRYIWAPERRRGSTNSQGISK